MLVRDTFVSGGAQSQLEYGSLVPIPAADFSLYLSQVLQLKPMNFRYKREDCLVSSGTYQMSFENLRSGIFSIYTIGMGYVDYKDPKKIKDYEWPRANTRPPSLEVEDAIMARFRIDTGADKLFESLKKSKGWSSLDQAQQRLLKLIVDHTMIVKAYHQAPPSPQKEAMTTWVSQRMSGLIENFNFKFRNQNKKGEQILNNLFLSLRKLDQIAYSALMVELSEQAKLELSILTNRLYSTSSPQENAQEEAVRRTKSYEYRGWFSAFLITGLSFLALEQYSPLWYTNVVSLNSDFLTLQPEGKWTFVFFSTYLGSILGEWGGEFAAYVKNHQRRVLDRYKRFLPGSSLRENDQIVSYMVDSLKAQGQRNYKLCRELML